MANSKGFIMASVAGAIIGGLFHLVTKKPVNNIENPKIQDDNKGAENADTQKPVDSIGAGQLNSGLHLGTMENQPN